MTNEDKKNTHPRKLIDHLDLFNSQIGDELKWPLKGIASGFDVIDECVDNFKPGLYIFAGGTGTGKSSFLSNLMFGILSQDKNTCGIHFSYDVNYLEQVGKYLSLASNLPLDLIKNPKKIEEDDLEKRFEGLDKLREIQTRLIILDQNHDVQEVSQIEQEIIELKNEYPNSPIVITIDPVSQLVDDKHSFGNERDHHLIVELKRISRIYEVVILMGVDLDVGAREKRPKLSQLEKKVSLMYGAEFIALLYNDTLNNFDTPLLEWEWASKDTMVPIIELNIVKNKSASFLGRLFYRFYGSQCRYKECVKHENEYYNEMIENMDHFDEDPKKRKSISTGNKVYVTPKRKFEKKFEIE
ncbi:MAG: hypothetical protein COB02_07850 [Candidatus Cloacimonadota bacterium]|nr:MAG: hypothetical protein COB02_07850 [Candidatus Cloacimonadota bacterium]